jgi:DNA-binding transcriptional LysR family regulator
MQTIVGLVSAGMGIAIVPACMRGLARPGVLYKNLSPAPTRIDTVLVRPTAGTRAVAETFVTFAAALGRSRATAARS